MRRRRQRREKRLREELRLPSQQGKAGPGADKPRREGGAPGSGKPGAGRKSSG